jgi:uncharacterized protein YbjQ (UPF0145 family)
MHIASFTLALSLAGCASNLSSRSSSSDPSIVGTNRTETSMPRIPVSTEQNCPLRDGRPCEILEIVDLHTEATSEDKGFDELRARAAAEGGEAVMAAEFEHGEGDKPSHLSGMVVRYGQPIPAHETIGELDIPSDPTERDKGMTAMLERAHEMGGSRVIDVTFEHGEDGKQGHLRGRVIRYLP